MERTQRWRNLLLLASVLFVILLYDSLVEKDTKIHTMVETNPGSNGLPTRIDEHDPQVHPNTINERSRDNSVPEEESDSSNSSKWKHNEQSESAATKENETKVILFWTPRHGRNDWSWGSGQNAFSSCKYDKCRFSTNKSEVREADMLLFFSRQQPKFPNMRLPHQLYVHFTREAPLENKLWRYSAYNDQINMSVSYRRDGNIPAPYFTIQPREHPTHRYTPRVPFQNRSRTIAWMVSNCETPSRREEYVTELKRHIDVDIFGDCGNLTCDSKQQDSKDWYSTCFSMFEKNYKFYLALENNVCKDYHTEKLMNAFQHEIVPIVFGGEGYKDYYPDNSLIDITNYPHPKHLAERLLSMSESDYENMLQWKSTYRVGHVREPCVLCWFLQKGGHTRGERVLPSSHGMDYGQWWADSCHNERMTELRERGGW